VTCSGAVGASPRSQVVRSKGWSCRGGGDKEEEEEGRRRPVTRLEGS
jgi:hypothetical protein